MLEVWNSLPSQYRISDPNRRVTVWRADKIGKAMTGFAHKAQVSDPERMVLQAALAGPDSLFELINRHTSCSDGSPLVSVTTDLRFAQLYAADPDETIYELTVPATRVLRDPFRTGAPEWPVDTEMFVVGNIYPQEVSAVKVNNHDLRASELNFAEIGVSVLADFLTDVHTIPRRDTPNPLGQWQGY